MPLFGLFRSSSSSESSASEVSLHSVLRIQSVFRGYLGRKRANKACDRLVAAKERKDVLDEFSQREKVFLQTVRLLNVEIVDAMRNASVAKPKSLPPEQVQHIVALTQGAATVLEDVTRAVIDFVSEPSAVQKGTTAAEEEAGSEMDGSPSASSAEENTSNADLPDGTVQESTSLQDTPSKEDPLSRSEEKESSLPSSGEGTGGTPSETDTREGDPASEPLAQEIRVAEEHVERRPPPPLQTASSETSAISSSSDTFSQPPSPGTPIRSGRMLKRGVTNPAFKERLIELLPGRLLYRADADANARGAIPLEGSFLIREGREMRIADRSGRTWCLQCSSDDECAEWASAILASSPCRRAAGAAEVLREGGNACTGTAAVECSHLSILPGIDEHVRRAGDLAAQCAPFLEALLALQGGKDSSKWLETHWEKFSGKEELRSLREFPLSLLQHLGGAVPILERLSRLETQMGLAAAVSSPHQRSKSLSDMLTWPAVITYLRERVQGGRASFGRMELVLLERSTGGLSLEETDAERLVELQREVIASVNKANPNPMIAVILTDAMVLVQRKRDRTALKLNTSFPLRGACVRFGDPFGGVGGASDEHSVEVTSAAGAHIMMTFSAADDAFDFARKLVATAAKLVPNTSEVLGPAGPVLKRYGVSHRVLLSTIHSACLRGDIDELSEITSSNMSADMSLPDEEDGATPLHLAAVGGYREVAQHLLALDAFADARDRHGFTPLMLAAVCGHTGVLEVLAQHGALVDAVDSAGRTAVYLAVLARRDVSLCSLGRCGANLDKPESRGWSPLHAAAQDGCYEVTVALCKEGADPNARSLQGRAPLHYATNAMEVDVVRVLLEFGGKPNLRSRDGTRPLTLALINNFGAGVTKLVENGARVELEETADSAARDVLSSLPQRSRESLSVLYDRSFRTRAAGREQMPRSTRALIIAMRRSKILRERGDTVDRRSCWCCGRAFSGMMDFVHRCSLCYFVCCGQCSSHSFPLPGAESHRAERVCDGCFNHLWTSSLDPFGNVPSAEKAVAPKPSQAEEKSALFAGRVKDKDGERKDYTPGMFSRGKDVAKHRDDTRSVMEENRKMLHERGQKLASLADRSEEMANEAQSFAGLAKQLAQKYR